MLNEDLTGRVLKVVERRLEYVLTQFDATPRNLLQSDLRCELHELLAIHAHLARIEHESAVGMPTS